jgi:peptidoglycan/LPS O-acetylase OafA/YrhL
MGIVVAISRSWLTAMLRRNLLVVIALGSGLMLWRHTLDSFGMSDWLLSLLAAGAILAALEFSGLDRVLLARPLQWLGQVSYSLYLVHVPILLAALHGLAAATGVLVAVLVAIPCSLVVALLLNRYVEQPAARLGRSRVMKRPLDGSATLKAEIR